MSSAKLTVKGTTSYCLHFVYYRDGNISSAWDISSLFFFKYLDINKEHPNQELPGKLYVK
jgi:hypothetical protein